MFIGGERIGGYDDLRRHFGLKVADPEATSYVPVIAVFAAAAALALAASQAVFGNPFTVRAGEWFVAFAMVDPGDAQAAGRRAVLDDVPELRPAGQALGAVRYDLPVRRVHRRRR